MFGYVVVNKPEMKFKEFAKYRSYYCGLCKSLQRQYGLSGKLALSYDMTFLVMLLTGLYEPKEEQMRCKCILHPFEKFEMCRNEMCDYGADMTILLARYKCLDDWNDEKKVTKGIYAGLLSGSYERIVTKYPKKVERIEKLVKESNEIEAKGERNIDILSAVTGNIMAELFAFREDEWEDELRTMGFYLGKFVYIMDAYDDIEKDVKKGNFNPFLEKYKEDNFEKYVYDILMMIAASCAESFEKLPIIEHIEILRNIMYSGIWTRFAQVTNKRNIGGKDERSI